MTIDIPIPKGPTIHLDLPFGADDDEPDPLEDVDHGLLVSPDGMDLDAHAARAGEEWTRTLFVAAWPDVIRPGLLDMVTTYPSAAVDVTIHASPRQQTRAIQQVKGKIRELQSELHMKEQTTDPTVELTRRKLEDHMDVLGQLTTGDTPQSIFDVSVYVTVRADDKDTLYDRSDKVEDELERKGMTVKAVDHRQERGLASSSTIAKDLIANDIPDVSTPMLGGGLAALLPWSATTILHPDGVPFGYHATTQEPIILDRFASDNGYNVLTFGMIGAGKSFSTKLRLLRELAKQPETTLIMIDPRDELASLADILGSQKHVVGGSKTFNPLELRPTPPSILQQHPEIDPWGQWFSGVMGFFDSFAAYQGTDDEGLTKEEHSVLGAALRQAAREKGIRPDPSTHDAENATIQDVERVLARIDDETEAFLDEVNDPEAPEPTDRDIETWERAASNLKIALRPFHNEFTHLYGPSEFDLSAKSVLLDIQQGESKQELALSMQPLLSAVHERAKMSEGRVIICIDEAHLLMQNGAALDWLERLTRVSRHYDLSIDLITQRAADFLVNDQAETIAGNFAHTIAHREPSISKGHAAALGLSDREAEFIRNAKSGTRERGYSHALLDVEGGPTIPAMVAPLGREAELLDGETTREAMDRASI